MIKNNFLASISDLLKVCAGVVIVGIIALAIIFSILFSAGFVIGCGVCIADVWLLAFMVSKITSEDGLGAKYAFLFVGKTLILFGVLAGCIFVLSKLSMTMFWGFISGLFLVPVSVVVLLIFNVVKSRMNKN